MRRFIDTAIDRAGAILNWDGGAAWDRVTAALIQRDVLTGEEVREAMELDGPLSPPEELWSKACAFVEAIAGWSDDEFKTRRKRFRTVSGMAEHLRKESVE